MFTTQCVASQILSQKDKASSSAIRICAADCILDAISAYLAGFDCCSAVRTCAKKSFAPGTSPLWFTGTSLSAVGAAFCNSAAMAALDFDDGHRAARGHPGSAIIPTALALVNKNNQHRLFAAIALAYEYAVRIATAQNTDTIRSRQTGRWSGFGSVVCAAVLCGLEENMLANALAITGVLSPNQEANGSSGYAELTGNDVKEGIPWSVVTGFLASDLSRSGYTGPLDLFDHVSYYRRDIIEGHGPTLSAISQIYFKPFSCCRYIHPAIDALSTLFHAHRLTHDQIEAVDVWTFGHALKLGNKRKPQTLQDVQYSLPYCLAIAAVDGPMALSPLAPVFHYRADIGDFAERISMQCQPELEKRFPEQTLAQISLRLKNGLEIVSQITSPGGGADTPMSIGERSEKFLRSSHQKLSGYTQRILLAAIDDLRSGDPGLLIRYMGRRLIDCQTRGPVERRSG